MRARHPRSSGQARPLALPPSPLALDASGAVLVRVKVVPGASRNELVGRHGDRLRVRVSAPPEAGQANRAVLELLAGRLGVSPRALTLTAGVSAPLKTVCVQGLALADVAKALDLA